MVYNSPAQALLKHRWFQFSILKLVNGVGVELSFLSCLTDRGTVQKVIVLPRDDLQTEELVLEEVEVFKVSCPTLFFIYFVLLFIMY